MRPVNAYSFLASIIPVLVSGGGEIEMAVQSALPLVEAEQAFCQTVEEEGIRKAFLEFLSEDGVVFQPGPVLATEWYREHPSGSGVLAWEPIYAEISGAGDLGYTTGPWEYKTDPHSEKPVGFGHYISIWRTRNGAPWRVLVDVGVAHEPPADQPHVLELYEPPLRGYPDKSIDAERMALSEAERDFSHLAKTQGLGTALAAYAADDIRLYRKGHLPSVGKKTMLDHVGEGERYEKHEVMKTAVSVSMDLGYTYGSTMVVRTPAGKGSSETIGFLRIWRRNQSSRWRIVLDVGVPIE